MFIKNFKQLAGNPEKKFALSILEKGLKGAMPFDRLRSIVQKRYMLIDSEKISLRDYEKVYLVAIGKGADLMAHIIDKRTRVAGGIVVVPKQKSLLSQKKFKIMQSTHPLPSAKSVRAARIVIDFLKGLKKNDFVIFLISGGASSLVSLPDGISIREKRIVTDLLIKSGADIHEINCVRKHLSKIKGGRLVAYLGCDAVSLVLSDVIDDDLSAIGSGLVYCDRTTFLDARKVIAKYGLRKSFPKRVLERINLGTQGLIRDTPKRPRIRNYVISSNGACIDTMKIYAEKLGFYVKTARRISGSVDSVTLKISRSLPRKKHSCLIFGGEPTVKVKGGGRGGRNQELVLRLLDKIHSENITFASLGTDGIDGNTNAAGAIATSEMPRKEIRKFLKENNSFSYFKKFGGLIFTGPTHTNLMDIGLVLLG